MMLELYPSHLSSNLSTKFGSHVDGVLTQNQLGKDGEASVMGLIRVAPSGKTLGKEGSKERLLQKWVGYVLNCPSLPLPDTSMSATLHCPTCVAVGTCLNAPSLPCPNGTTQCYRGKIELNGGKVK